MKSKLKTTVRFYYMDKADVLGKLIAWDDYDESLASVHEEELIEAGIPYTKSTIKEV